MRIVLLAALGLLAGCGAGVPVDDPANPPRLGTWTAVARITSLTFDDRAIPPEMAPIPIPPPQEQTLDCVEPKLRTAAEFNEVLASTPASKCHIDAVDRDGADVTGSGACELPAVRGVDLDGTIRLAGEQAAGSVVLRPAITVTLRTPDGQTHHVRVASRVDWTRTGDCVR
jgi:hypothetical protein